MDETACQTDPYLCKCWMKKGEQRRIPAGHGASPPVHIFGALNSRDNTIVATFAAKRNGEGFIGWLEHLLYDVYPQQTVYLVLDNASFHKSAAVQATYALFEERLVIFWLPTYAPQLNPIERYWRHLKQACGNHLFACQEELLTALRAELARQNDSAQPHRFTTLH